MANNSEIFLSIDLKKYCFRISMQALKSLEYPTYVQFLINPEDGFIAVLGSDKPIKGSSANKIDLERLKNNSTIEFYSRHLIERLNITFGSLEVNCSYRMKGEIDKINRVAYFSMSTLQKYKRKVSNGT